MISYAVVDENNRIQRLYSFPIDEPTIQINNQEYVDEACVDGINDFIVVDNMAVYSPTIEKLEANAAKESQRIYNSQFETAVSMFVNTQASSMSEEDMLQVEMLFAEWTIGNSYKTGDVVRYQGGLWQALQNSTAQDIYPPDQFVAGWKRIGNPNPKGIFPWSQPLGATDAYPLGAKVTHKGKTWESTIANNVWEPGVYGWEEVSDETTDPEEPEPKPEEPEGPITEEYPEWVQPTGAHDAYSIGDKVTHNGKTWESTIANNVWEPGVYGWE